MEMSATIRPTRLVLVFMLLMMIGARVDAQDVVKVSPDTVKVILENDQVRVIESTIPPGTLQAKHSHPATIVYYLTASKVKSEGPDGKLVVTERPRTRRGTRSQGGVRPYPHRPPPPRPRWRRAGRARRGRP